MVVTEQFESELVSNPAQYDVLLPPSYADSDKTYPLLYWLHGGGGPEMPANFLGLMEPRLTTRWAKGTLTEMVVVTPHCGVFPNNYLDFPDGSRHWESFVARELLNHLRSTYRISRERSGTFIGGVSMGGLGSLTIGLKHLDTFSAIIAFEPQIAPTFEKPDGYPEFYTKSFHDQNQPANIVRDNPDPIRASGVQIYFECGSKDELGFFVGTNLLHNTLLEKSIHHEYKYVCGAGHVDESFDWRIPDGLAFLERVINPPPKNAPSVRDQESAQQIAADREAFLKSRWDSIL